MPKSVKRTIPPKILIFCNGELAEPKYFQDFKHDIKSTLIKIRIITGSPWELVAKTVKILESEKRIGKFSESDGDQCWCVFDIDEYLKQNPKKFNELNTEAAANGINLGWSNECFELWYLLHFQAVQVGIPRKDYHKKLAKHFNELDGKDYSKNESVYARISHLIPKAIKNAKQIFSQANFQTNPSTSIFKLIEELLKLKK